MPRLSSSACWHLAHSSIGGPKGLGAIRGPFGLKVPRRICLAFEPLRVAYLPEASGDKPGCAGTQVNPKNVFRLSIKFYRVS